MYQQFAGRNANTLYHKALRTLVEQGERVAPKGRHTLELQALTTILEPLERVLTVPGRAANPFFNVAENLAIIAGLDDQRRWFKQFNKQYLEVAHDSPDDKASWAFYGTRLRKYPAPHTYHPSNMMDQLQEITSKLKADSFSRQAVAVLWDPTLDNEPGHRDYPCNFAVEFKIRNRVRPTRVSGSEEDKLLHMTVINRSNDIHWGLYGVNLNQWSFIQEVMASILGTYIGHQIHVSDSLHLYLDEPHVSITRSVLNQESGFDIYTYTSPTKMFESQQDWKLIDEALKIFFDDWYESKPTTTAHQYGWTFLRDAWFFLNAYKSRRVLDQAMEYLNHVDDAALWVSGVEYLHRGKPHAIGTEINVELEQRFSFENHRNRIREYMKTANTVKTFA